MTRIRWICCLAIFVLLFACNLPIGTAPAGSPLASSPSASSPDTEEPATLSPAPPTTSPVPPLTEAMLKNATYHLPQLGLTATLTDGVYQSGSGDNIIDVRLLDPIAFGDLNGDGAEDAAVLISENSGGTGVFISLIAMLNQGGAPLQSASAYIDDRAQTNGLSIDGGAISVDAVIHGPADPMCCPSFPVVETYRLSTTVLTLTRLTSTTPDSAVRAILIGSPASGAEATGGVTIAGSVTIAPFENTLAYRIVDGLGNVLAQGSFLVDASVPGGPGTFNTAISLAGIPAESMVRLEVLDLSAADGSILAMDSIELLVH